ncbi:MAG: PSD1 and planctomycete cytochrome C domain-containing protein [Verrucomicrobiota bacterium]|nr:PSD1 and planctomycete cytochrome C domain-containing protein [Verrucomicrobiota bacterium]
MKVATAICSALIIFSCAKTNAAIDFARDVRPILNEHCTKCHGGIRAKSGLNLISKDSVFSGTESGLIPVVSGNLERSELIRRINLTDEEERMPPKKPLNKKQIDTLNQWVKEGANWPTHWSFSSLKKEPETNQTIDSIIKAKLKDSGLTISPIADKRTLIRRLSLDLLGLPPEPGKILSFESDKSQNAYAKLVEELLNSPHFGERWARHWLDGARYADSDGYEKDNNRPNAWRWRKWVIDSINADMPFDQFTIEQLAGDLLPNATSEQHLATAFHRQTLYNREGGVDAEEDRTKRTIDRSNTTASVWLGLSLECSQCHDHPYDPISQRDFYQFYAFFNDTDEGETEVTKGSGDGTMKVRVMRQKDRETYIFRRGDFLQPMKEKGEILPLGPDSLPAMETSKNKKLNRLDLARWLVNEKNPLSARVTVNDIWYRLFGAGLTEQKADFGTRSAPPFQVELLDHLAERLIDMNWSRKSLIRYIVTSDTYQQSTTRREIPDQIDPDNKWFHRQNRYRTDGEIIRDLFLSISGLLKHNVGGPSVFPPIPKGVAEQSFAGSFKWNTSKGDDRYRRGMYTFFKRTAPDPNLITFDCPNANVTIAKRNNSNTPIMALATLGNEVFHESAQAFAKRILSDKSYNDDYDRIKFAFLLCVARNPSPQESNEVIKLLQKSRSYYEKSPEEATKMVGKHSCDMINDNETASWITVTRVLLNLDETINRE